MLIIGFEQKVDRQKVEEMKNRLQESGVTFASFVVNQIGEFDGDKLYIIDCDMIPLVAAIENGVEVQFVPQSVGCNPYSGLSTYEAMNRNADNHYYYYWVHNGEYLSEPELEEIYREGA